MERVESAKETSCVQKSPPFYQIIPAKVTTYLRMLNPMATPRPHSIFPPCILPHWPVPSSLSNSPSLVSDNHHLSPGFSLLSLLILSSFLKSWNLSYNLNFPPPTPTKFIQSHVLNTSLCWSSHCGPPAQTLRSTPDPIYPAASWTFALDAPIGISYSMCPQFIPPPHLFHPENPIPPELPHLLESHHHPSKYSIIKP